MAVTIAVFIAHNLGYEEVTSAAIVALFTVQRTFYHSLLQSLGKVGSVLLGGMLGTVLAVILGGHALTFGLVTLLVIVLSLNLKLHSHIPIALVTAVLMIAPQADTFQTTIIFEQVLLALIGAVSALGINYFFSPNHKQKLKCKVEGIDKDVRSLLNELAHYVQHPPETIDSSFIDRLEQMRTEINRGIEMSKLFQDEQKFQSTDNTLADIYRLQFRSFEYFIDCIEEIYHLTVRMTIEVPQSEQIAKLFRILEKMQKNALQNRRAPYRLVETAIGNLEKQYDEMELPRTRDEFKSRASLFHVLQELKRYYKRIKKLPNYNLNKLTDHEKVKAK